MSWWLIFLYWIFATQRAWLKKVYVRYSSLTLTHSLSLSLSLSHVEILKFKQFVYFFSLLNSGNSFRNKTQLFHFCCWVENETNILICVSFIRENVLEKRRKDRAVKSLNKPGVNPTKLFFFVDEEFFRFSLLSLAVVQDTHFFHLLQTLKLNSKNWKTGKMKVW